MNEVIIYAIIYLDKVEYIGRTALPLWKRLLNHRGDAGRKNTPISKWLGVIKKNRELKNLSIAEIEKCQKRFSKERERYWINHYNKISPVLNLRCNEELEAKNREAQIVKENNNRDIRISRISQDVFDALKKSAKCERRKISQQALYLIAKGLKVK